jgi:hypothetical protein
MPSTKLETSAVVEYAGLGQELYENDRELVALAAPYEYLKGRNDALKELAKEAKSIFEDCQKRVFEATSSEEADAESMPAWKQEKAAQMAAAVVVARKEAINIRFPVAEARSAIDIAKKGHPGFVDVTGKKKLFGDTSSSGSAAIPVKPTGQ